MVSGQVKMIVAQNCPGYQARYGMVMSTMGSLSQSCSNCGNWIRGRCIKDLFDEVRERIRVN